MEFSRARGQVTSASVANWLRMARNRHTTVTLGAAVLCLLLLAVASPSLGQVVDDVTTTTTEPPSSTTTTTSSTTTSTSTTTTTAPSTTDGSTPAPADPSPDGGGDGDAGDGSGDGDVPRTVPPEAQRIIDAVPRTAPNSSQALYDAVQQLVDLGLSPEEAIRVGFGRFPVAGVARYSHDWLYPRWGPGFRFHHGTDVVAPYGTPLRAPVDGTVTASTSALGGLSTKIHMPDGTYFYYAHLSGLVEGFTNGMAVETGDIVGYIGDSGNARGGVPHLHIGIYPKGGGPTDPKPILDQWLADAMEQLPLVIARVEEQQRAADAQPAPGTRTPRSLLATALLRPLTDRTAGGEVPTEVLYQASGNPSGGLSMAGSEAQQLAASIDWDELESRAAAEQLLLERARALLGRTLGVLGD